MQNGLQKRIETAERNLAVAPEICGIAEDVEQLLARFLVELDGGRNLVEHDDEPRLRAGAVQMGIDAIIVLGAIFVVTPDKVALSVLGAVMLNLVLALNHRSDRYVGVS